MQNQAGSCTRIQHHSILYLRNSTWGKGLAGESAVLLYNEHNFLHTPMLNVVQCWAKSLEGGRGIGRNDCFLGRRRPSALSCVLFCSVLHRDHVFSPQRCGRHSKKQAHCKMSSIIKNEKPDRCSWGVVQW